MSAEDRVENRFFIGMALIILFLVLCGFGPTYYWRAEEAYGPLDPLYGRHGIAYSIWFTLFVVQAGLIGANKHQIHMGLGILSLIVVAMMLWTGLGVAVDSYQRGVAPPPMGRAGFQFLTLSDLFVFALLYGLGIANRERPDHHKRFMLVASISILMPATARWMQNALNEGLWGAGIVVMLLALVAFFDWKQRRSLHRATMIAGGAELVKLAITMPVATSDTWARFIEAIYPA